NTTVRAWFHFPLDLKIKIFKLGICDNIFKIFINTLTIFVQENSTVFNLPCLTRFPREIRMPALQIFTIKKQLPSLLFFFCSQRVYLCCGTRQNKTPCKQDE